ncbi:general amidase GmdA, putative [Trichophyton benhamiae CBS 112371]|uniref:amidase n=1 Tax=Arthroderma benhamiae (strain ATCC MYA-4681 / CBS 112371) TaxID=663331 RepID=D4AQ73_ARTBC|nr:general amidase GmdA, putative [Trichophyton benhamiae CBS 112371]EFE34617.1 general amidase GmdA, putative [Trichophyton benhamiae CBS 112371]
MVKEPEAWEEKAAVKRAVTVAKIPEEWRLTEEQINDAKAQRQLAGAYFQGFLTDEERKITGEESTEIVSKIKSKEYSALKVAKAYCKAAAVAHQMTSCLHEVFFDQALERAKYLDEYVEKHGKTMGPLHGLPISLKDQFHVKGNDTTMGYVGWIDTFEGDKGSHKVHNFDSPIVTDLLSLGAVLYCKIGETENHIIGRVLNPWNNNLSCGGSSGGEGVMLALGASSAGLGTDLGGSVRVPAGFCGVYGLKPTHDRLPYRDVANTNPGQNTYSSSIGVLSTSHDSIQLMMKSMLSTQPWLRDPVVFSVPWRDEIVAETLARVAPDGSAKSDQKSLKFGILYTDNIVTPHPPVTRGLHALEDALKKAGHKVVSWNPPPHSTAIRIHLEFMSADGGNDIKKQLSLSGEPPIPQIKIFVEGKEPLPLLEYQDLILQGIEYAEAYADYWNSTAQDDGQIVDAVIAPLAPWAAVIPTKYYHTGKILHLILTRHDTQFLQSPAYTEVINLLDYSASVVPVTKADKNVDVADPDYEPISELDKANWELYDPELFNRTPVGMQLIGRKHEEEKIWAIGKIVDNIMKKAKSG